LIAASIAAVTPIPTCTTKNGITKTRLKPFLKNPSRSDGFFIAVWRYSSSSSSSSSSSRS